MKTMCLMIKIVLVILFDLKLMQTIANWQYNHRDNNNLVQFKV